MDRKKIESLLELPLSELVSIADEVRRREAGQDLELCSIMNAKSGMCPEDCKFCAQSSRHSTGAAIYPLKGKDDIVAAARRAKDIGAHRFDIVTSGDALSRDELEKIAEAVSEIRTRIGIDMCASLGKIDEAGLRTLKDAGLSRYHHNIETSPNYYSQIVSTHKFEERLQTIEAAKRVGLQVCCGGIIGMGETWRERIEMALLLRDLNVDSVPINILVPIKGTQLEGHEALACADAIRAIAIFRIVLKDKLIKIAAGRERILKDFQAMAFMAGANGMLIGGYLTIKGRSVEEDWKLVEEVKRIWNG